MWERGFTWRKSCLSETIWNLQRAGKVNPEVVFNKSWRGPMYEILKGAWSSPGWLSVPSLCRLTCGGLCSEHKSLVCPGSLGLAVASAGAQPHAQPRLWGQSGACKGERASSPEENREAESQRQTHIRLFWVNIQTRRPESTSYQEYGESGPARP